MALRSVWDKLVPSVQAPMPRDDKPFSMAINEKKAENRPKHWLLKACTTQRSNGDGKSRAKVDTKKVKDAGLGTKGINFLGWSSKVKTTIKQALWDSLKEADSRVAKMAKNTVIDEPEICAAEEEMVLFDL